MELKIKPKSGSRVTFKLEDNELEIHIGEKNDLYHSWLSKKQINQLKQFLNTPPQDIK